MNTHRSGAGSKGAVIGGFSGMIIGMTAGLIMGTDRSGAFQIKAGMKALFLGTGGLAGGLLIGGIIGNIIKKKFIIGGNKKSFEDIHRSVLSKA